MHSFHQNLREGPPGPSGRAAEWMVLPGAPGRRSAPWPQLSAGPCPATCRIPAFCSSVWHGWALSWLGSAPATEPSALPPRPPLPITPFARACDAGGAGLGDSCSSCCLSVNPCIIFLPCWLSVTWACPSLSPYHAENLLVQCHENFILRRHSSKGLILR